jgi:hypothetical protein
MKPVACLLIALTGTLAVNTARAETPRGTLLEMHSCEVYAGGCVVSSEATLGGRYLLRVWNLRGGAFADCDLAGLQVALLQTSAQNLAEPKSDAGHGVVYLPANATAAQRDALLAWLGTQESSLKHATLKTRVVPLHIGSDQSGYIFTAGDFLSVKTASLDSCETGACGESLWYAPRSETSVFTVAVDRASNITEPLLQVKWVDAGKRSIFLGKFGDTAKNTYVTSADLCGPTARLF